MQTNSVRLIDNVIFLIDTPGCTVYISNSF